MSLKNLNANKIHRVLRKKIINKKIKHLFNLFEKELRIKEKFSVAVSGGPDSLALAFLAKVYSIKNKLAIKFFIVDHKLRKESTDEAKKVKKLLKGLNINSEILSWNGKKPKKNIQSIARKKRYELLFSKCKKYKINNLLLGHHLDDLYENFFIRIVRGSGLKGLASLEKKNQINKINLIRPLLVFDKSDLIFISEHVFNFFIVDPSNKDFKYTRVRIRSFIDELKKEGFDKNKLFLTIKNLRRSNQTLSFYVEQNKRLNSFLNQKKNELILNENFFKNPYEIIFRSMIDSIKIIGGKYNTVRGKKIDNILNKIENNVQIKETLGGCIIKKLNQTVIISKED
jgi:tRNA(Ile)-lysidine synthase